MSREMNRSAARGVAMVLLAAILWGTTGTAQSFAPLRLSSYWIGALRLVVAGLFFLPWVRLAERPAPTRAAMAALPWPGILAAAACICAYNLAFFAGVRASGVAIGTAVALGSGPVWAGVLQALGRGGVPPRPWWIGTGIAVAGLVGMVAGPGGTRPASISGIGLCLLAGLSYACFALVNKRLVAQAAAGLVTAAVFVAAAALAVPFAWALAGAPMLRMPELVVVAWLGIMSTGIAYLLFSHALRHISGASAVALALGEPVTAFVLAVAVVGERPGLSAVLGLLAVVAGLGGVIRAEVGARAAGRR